MSIRRLLKSTKDWKIDIKAAPSNTLWLWDCFVSLSIHRTYNQDPNHLIGSYSKLNIEPFHTLLFCRTYVSRCIFLWVFSYTWLVWQELLQVTTRSTDMHNYVSGIVSIAMAGAWVKKVPTAARSICVFQCQTTILFTPSRLNLLILRAQVVYHRPRSRNRH